jgi:hypothetical protein
LIEIIERLRIQFGIFDADAEGIFDEERQIHQAEGVDQSAGDEGFIRGDDLARLLEDFLGNELCDGGR